MFYISFLVLGLVAVMVLGYMSALVLGVESYEDGYSLGLRVGQVGAIIMVIVLGLLQLKEKRLMRNGTFVIIFLLAVLLSLPLGFMGGLIPLAYLSTRAE